MKKLSLKKLQQLIQERGPEVYDEVIRVLGTDPRGGAQKLVRYCLNQIEEGSREQARAARMYSYERQVWAMGYKFVAGVAEVGRGPLAGPVVGAAVILPGEVVLPGLDETKRLSFKRQQELYELIRQTAIAIGIGMVHPDGIDEANVMMATYKAMVKAVVNLPFQPDYLLTDGLHLPNVVQPQVPIADGDHQSYSIAAAGIVAKVKRNEYMVEMDQVYPGYGFASHKGYGTVEHREAINRYGLSPIHRAIAGCRPVSALPLTLFSND